MNASDAATTDRLLAALRQHTGRPDLDWARPPEPIKGGFWAEMYTVELNATAPTALRGRLVARIMPDTATARREAGIQRHLTRCQFPSPAIHCAGQPSHELDRSWILMDLAPGAPLLSGLNARTALAQAPALARRLPDVLADAAATLHRCSVEGLADELDGQPPTIGGFLHDLVRQAGSVDRPDLAQTAEQLREHAPAATAICHGDLHPLNLLVDDQRWTLIDWSTAVLADPHYDLAFTTLMLTNPPLGGPAPVRFVTRAVGRRLAHRFLRDYTRRTGTHVDAERLDWGRRVHAVRALVEIATWSANDQLADRHGHPWLTMRPHLERALA